MEDQSIKILQAQIEKLENKDFDLEAWKSSSIALLARIFGKDDYRLKQIQDLKIDYSSWALRDASSSYNPVKSCKRIGREILETSISEIQAFRSEPEGGEVQVLNALREELTGGQMKELEKLLASSKSKSEKRSGVVKVLNALGKGKANSVLATLLLSRK